MKLVTTFSFLSEKRDLSSPRKSAGTYDNVYIKVSQTRTFYCDPHDCFLSRGCFFFLSVTVRACEKHYAQSLYRNHVLVWDGFSTKHDVVLQATCGHV